MRAILFSIAILALAGCAAIQQNEAAQQEKWLREAGFREFPADTPQRRAALDAMTPYRVERVSASEPPVYRYANPVRGILLVGGSREYAAYRELSVSVRARRATNLAQMTPTSWRSIGPMVW